MRRRSPGGLLASGYPSVDGAPDTSLLGQLACTAILVAMGFGSGWPASKALAVTGRLRMPPAVEA